MLIYSRDFDPNQLLGRATLELVVRLDGVKLAIEPSYNTRLTEAAKTALNAAWEVDRSVGLTVVIGSPADADQLIAEHGLKPDLVYTAFTPDDMKTHYKHLHTKCIGVPSPTLTPFVEKYARWDVIRPGISENFAYRKLTKPPTPFVWGVIGRRAGDAYRAAKGQKSMMVLELPITEKALHSALNRVHGLIYLPDQVQAWDWVPRAAARMGLPVIVDAAIDPNIAGWGFALKDPKKLIWLVEYVMSAKRWQMWHNLPGETQSQRVAIHIRRKYSWDNFVQQIISTAGASAQQLSLAERRQRRRDRKRGKA